MLMKKSKKQKVRNGFSSLSLAIFRRFVASFSLFMSFIDFPQRFDLPVRKFMGKDNNIGLSREFAEKSA